MKISRLITVFQRDGNGGSGGTERDGTVKPPSKWSRRPVARPPTNSPTVLTYRPVPPIKSLPSEIPRVKTYANGNANFEKKNQIYCSQKTSEKNLVPPLWEKKENMIYFFIFLSPTAAGGAIWFFGLQIVNTMMSETSSCDD